MAGRRPTDSSDEFIDATDAADRLSPAGSPQSARFHIAPEPIAEVCTGDEGVLQLSASDMSQALGGLNEIDPASLRSANFRKYGMRWFMIITVALLNFSNTSFWISLASVANFADDFYGLKGAANYFSIVFQLVSVPVGLFGMWSSRKWGLRVAILMAGMFNGTGATIRLISCFLPRSFMLPVGLFGQGLCGCAYPFIMFLPAKVAGTWFPESERGIATTIGALSNPLGVFLPSLIMPKIVAINYHTAQVSETWHITLVTIAAFIPCIGSCLMAVLGVRTSEPPTPASFSSSEAQMPFLLGMKRCLTSRNFLLLMLILGCGLGMFNTVYTMVQQILCPWGYTNEFSGLVPVAMIGTGLVTGTVCGILVGKTRMFQEVFKVAFALSVLGGIGLMQFGRFPHMHVPILIFAALFGGFGVACYPVGLEMGAEVMFPVSETTSNGLLVLSGQVQGVIYIILMAKMGSPLDPLHAPLQTCLVAADALAVLRDMTPGVLAFSAIGAAICIINILFFWPKYRRMKHERTMRVLAEKDRGTLPGDMPPPYEIGNNGEPETARVQIDTERPLFEKS